MKTGFSKGILGLKIYYFALSAGLVILLSASTGFGQSSDISHVVVTPSAPANGVNTAVAVATIYDASGGLMSGQSVQLSTTRGATLDTITPSGTQLTDGNGQCTFTIKSSSFGPDTDVYAKIGGTNILHNLVKNPSFEAGTYAIGGSPANWTKVVVTATDTPAFTWDNTDRKFGSKSVTI